MPAPRAGAFMAGQLQGDGLSQPALVLYGIGFLTNLE